MVFGLHKHYLDSLRPNRKTLRIADTIEWVCENLKSQYGVPNFIRLSKELERPPASISGGVDLGADVAGVDSAEQPSASAQLEFRDESDTEADDTQAGEALTE
jgi:hypothetical protein